ncbi:hypothetical protein AVEN_92190-1 [Araneus ventricosus]|uniref:Uncharacterized protein n=1 Tax=Araneus ventricosus TaxID=182803 RepID=A0A4Y2AMN1_ARAVE|nr:hypothetical protein AVEN_92190-1 [Araneus ventricosus]
MQDELKSSFPEEQGERFHQDVRDIERRYQGRWYVNMLAYYCWILMRETEDAMECDRYGVADRTVTSFANAVLQDIGIVHEGEASHVVDRNKIRRQREKL